MNKNFFFYSNYSEQVKDFFEIIGSSCQLSRKGSNMSFEHLKASF